MNWTAVTRRLTKPDRVVTVDGRDDVDPCGPGAGQVPARIITDERLETEPTQALLRARPVRAFTPRDAYMPRHRADVPTDSVRGHEELTELRQAEVAATA